MVEAVRHGRAQREVARTYGVPLATVQWWLKRTAGQSLDHVDWANRSTAPRRVPHRTAPEIELMILACRQQLRTASALGFLGAHTIREVLQAAGHLARVPSVRTIGRILARHGVLDRARRVRHPAPPPGWYLPPVRLQRAELEAFDVIEGLVIEGQGPVEVLTGKALWGPHVGAWPMSTVTAQATLTTLVTHWRLHGLPDFVQFDNDTRFQGGHNHPDVVGRIIRLCLSLGVTPVFVPPRESGFQAVIEHFNGLWQTKVWARFHHADLLALTQRSQAFVGAYQQRLTQRAEVVLPRRPFPTPWRLNLQADLRGVIVYLRRTNAQGCVSLLGRTFSIDGSWAHRLVRCEVDLSQHLIRFYGLRRREPEDHPFIGRVDYRIPQKRFLE